MEKADVANYMPWRTKAVEAYKKLLNVGKDWKDEIVSLGMSLCLHPINFRYGDEGFTDDWAVLEVHPFIIAKLNLVGNAIDLASIAVDKLTAWMDPSQPSFNYPGSSLLRFFGVVLDDETFKLTNLDHNVMVMKNGSASNLTIGRLNTIRAFVRTYSIDSQPGKMSKKVCVLPRNSKSGSFSARGDSGSAVIDGISRVCSIITGRDGATDDSACTFVTFINLLLERSKSFDLEANIFPLLLTLDANAIPLSPHATTTRPSPSLRLSHFYLTYSVTLYLIRDDIWDYVYGLVSRVINSKRSRLVTDMLNAW